MNINIIESDSADVKIVVPDDEKRCILDILNDNKVFIDAPCNGNGTCGKCKIKAVGEFNPISETEIKLLNTAEIANSIRLACMTYPLSNCNIEIIGSNDYSVQTNSFSINDYTVNSRVSEGVGMAVDIGTTTVACYFYDLITGKKLYTASGLNAQKSFGADVISRIESCSRNGGELLKSTIIFELNSYIKDFCHITSGIASDITDGFIAGNTVMLHLLCGIDASKIAVAPFTPTSLFGYDVAASELGLNMAEGAMVYLADSVASYVGGDITAGLLSCNADEFHKPCLYIDIGTNGEMAIGDKNGFLCCATAAGPAFEGAHIKYGVGGIKGAISRVYIENDDFKFSVIGDTDPIGICGSGLIDCIACMLKLSIIDETGRLDVDEAPEKYLKRFKNDEFILDFNSGISITQKDIREVQLAKAAIRAGISTLLNKCNVDISEVDKVIVAGGFGSFIDIRSACEIGLLPIEKLASTSAVGNAAGTGAIKALLSKVELMRLKQISKSCNYFELSGDSFFQDEYVEQMLF